MYASKGTKREKHAKRKPPKIEPPTESEADLAALAEDCDREMYGDDYDYLAAVGWLDRE